jgi:hypothetical protein
MIMLFNTAIGRDLSYTNEAIIIKLGVLGLGLVLGAIAGIFIATSDPVAPPVMTQGLTTAEQQDAAKRAQDAVTKAQDESLSFNFKRSVRYTGFLFVDTARLLLPSAVISTKRSDTTYISDMSTTFKEMMARIKMDPEHRDVILQNWLPQIEWTNNRANRERDANEMMSWWQIILTALIPFIATADSIVGLKSTNVVAILGIFVTILTGLIRFRRPEERWKHYRRLTEDYQRELWNYISLSGPYKIKDESRNRNKDHDDLFKDFNEKMTVMRENDIRVFLGEVMNNVPTQTPGAVPQTQTAVTPPGVTPTLAPES